MNCASLFFLREPHLISPVASILRALYPEDCVLSFPLRPEKKAL
ncbi:hypothetical protein KC19_N038100 [Ceratodon purpureus]|nr:hypothetical protein KC19_N038100 [Ceratodon purpureus]